MILVITRLGALGDRPLYTIIYKREAEVKDARTEGGKERERETSPEAKSRGGGGSGASMCIYMCVACLLLLSPLRSRGYILAPRR